MGLYSDYGGNRQRTTHRRANYGDNAGQVSMRCLDCESLRYVAPLELARAAQPRCIKCGGPLEEIKASKKRRGMPTSKIAEHKTVARCRGCGAAIGSPFLTTDQAFRIHLTSRPDCERYYGDAKLPLEPKFCSR
jgi:hypothetical protein